MVLAMVFGGTHGSGWNNLRFYYNPITGKLMPIGFDSATKFHELYNPIVVDYDYPFTSRDRFNSLLFRDEKFMARYRVVLKRYAKMDVLIPEIRAVEKKENINFLNHPLFRTMNWVMEKGGGYIPRQVRYSNIENILEGNTQLIQKKVLKKKDEAM